MNKKIIMIFLVILMITVTGCKDNQKDSDLKWPIDAYFTSLPVPSREITKVNNSSKDTNKVEYSIIVKKYSYEEFHDYITKLENLGFNYEFYKDAVPEDKNKLSNKTETSWGANNGKIWIRALWRDDKNPNYTNYNFQLIFNNYDYLEPQENIEQESIESQEND